MLPSLNHALFCFWRESEDTTEIIKDKILPIIETNEKRRNDALKRAEAELGREKWDKLSMKIHNIIVADKLGDLLLEEGLLNKAIEQYATICYITSSDQLWDDHLAKEPKEHRSENVQEWYPQTVCMTAPIPDDDSMFDRKTLNENCMHKLRDITKNLNIDTLNLLAHYETYYADHKGDKSLHEDQAKLGGEDAKIDNIKEFDLG